MNEIKINEFIEDIKKIKKNKIIHTSNITANQSNKNSFNQSKNTIIKKIKTLTVSITNSNNNSTLKNNNNNNNNNKIKVEPEANTKNKEKKQNV